MSQSIRPAAVAGSFYPDSVSAINTQLDTFCRMSSMRHHHNRQSGAYPKALIVPHAGWVYSGQLAADAYLSLGERAARVKRVILLGPAHRVAFDGLALPTASGFATPLGIMPVDQATVSAVAGLPGVIFSDEAHRQEHSLEVQLPFLQRLLPEAHCLPVLVGRAAPEMVASLLNRLWGGEETLLVISSDLSHYQPYEQARANDWLSALSILHRIPLHSFDQACGALPINGLIQAAVSRGLVPRLLGAINSGDTAGDRNRVVGYGAFAFYQAQQEVPVDEQGSRLLALARCAIHSSLGLPVPPVANAPWLTQPAASFVTITKRGQLRGCMGSLEAHRALSDDIINNARLAAFKDPRFSAVQLSELADLTLEVSLLSASQPLEAKTEQAVLAQIRPGVDGLILQAGQQRGTFLPQVWSQIPAPAQFLAQLKAKAGLPITGWSEDWQLSRYTVTKWSEAALVAL